MAVYLFCSSLASISLKSILQSIMKVVYRLPPIRKYVSAEV
jgi:hypothetical protein